MHNVFSMYLFFCTYLKCNALGYSKSDYEYVIQVSFLCWIHEETTLAIAYSL